MTPAGDDTSTTTPDRDLAEATREAQEAAADAAQAADKADHSADAAAESAEQADESADEASESADEADESAEKANGSADKADESAGKAGEAAEESVEDTKALVEKADDDLANELLIEERHPDVGMGLPGPPLRRSSPFMFGFFAALGVLVAWGLWNAAGQARSVLILLLVSMFIAVGLNPLVEWFMRRGLKRGLSVGVVFLLMILAVAGVGFAIVPVVTDQINSLIRNAPQWLDLLQKSQTLDELDKRYHYVQKAKDYIQDPALAQRAFGGILGVGKVVANALFNTFTILILTLYFLSSLPQIKTFFYKLAPRSRRARVALLGDEILDRIGGYVAGQFTIAFIAGVCSYIFLSILGVKYALALALIVAVTDLIPLIGATIGAVIVCLVAFLTGDTTDLIVCAVFYLIYQQVENYLVYPRVMKRTVDVQPAVTIVAALVGAALLGVVGALLAIPTAAAISLLIREVVVPRQETL